MVFDDRLETVLRNRGSSEGFRCTQFRQLLDILGAEQTASGPRHAASSVFGEAENPELIAAAWMRMDALATSIPDHDRAAMIMETGWRFRNPELAMHLAQFEPAVASAALSRAQLTEEDWIALIPRLPITARGFLRLRREMPDSVVDLLERLGVHDRGLPGPDRANTHAPPEENEPAFDQPVTNAAPDPHETSEAPAAKAQAAEAKAGDDNAAGNPADTSRSEISALVDRIARFKRTRDEAGPPSAGNDDSMPRLPLGEEVDAAANSVISFGFAADTDGRIDWADPEIASMVVGAKLVNQSRSVGTDADATIFRAVHRRQPIEGARTHLTGARDIAGWWTVDARPRFDVSGNFIGYAGRFRRPSGNNDNGDDAAAHDADRIRQLLHELRTPVTAIQGYAEVVQQQLFGSASHEYRAVAAAIASDAARILSAFEDLDRLARLESGALLSETGESDFGAAVRQTAAQLTRVLGKRLSGIEIEIEDIAAFPVALTQHDIEAIVWRVLATIGGACASGEKIAATLTRQSDHALLECELPALLVAQDDLFACDVRPVAETVNAGPFGAGFTLRLARAEARSAGGDLELQDETLVLTLPLQQTDTLSGAA